MGRVVILEHERRDQTPENAARRAEYMRERAEREGREIPIKYSNGNGPIITSTVKLVAFLITVITAFALAYGAWLRAGFVDTVDSRFTAFELRMTKEYPLAKDTMPRSEYELRHSELIAMDKNLRDALNEEAHARAALEERVNKLAERVLANEQSGRRK